jgi:hypothetical protein
MVTNHNTSYLGTIFQNVLSHVTAVFGLQGMTQGLLYSFVCGLSLHRVGAQFVDAVVFQEMYNKCDSETPGTK